MIPFFSTKNLIPDPTFLVDFNPWSTKISCGCDPDSRQIPILDPFKYDDLWSHILCKSWYLISHPHVTTLSYRLRSLLLCLNCHYCLSQECIGYTLGILLSIKKSLSGKFIITVSFTTVTRDMTLLWCYWMKKWKLVMLYELYNYLLKDREYK